MQQALFNAILLFLLACLLTGGKMDDKFTACLPEGIKLDEAVSAPRLKSPAKAADQKVTVKEILLHLNAHCENGKLVDGAGREIRFHRLVGCWGNPPEDYQEQLAQQQEELQRLKKKYTVVEIPCAQGDPTRIQ